MLGQRTVSLFRVLAALCCTIASFPRPHKQSRPAPFQPWGHSKIAHKQFANFIPYPAAEVGRDRCIVRVIVESNRVVASQRYALPQVSKAEGLGRLTTQHSTQ